MSVSISQVALKARVSTMTVSRVLTGNGSVSDKTRKRVLKIITDLGYVPSAAARSMRSKDVLRSMASSCFALIFGADTQMADEFFCDVARGAERESVKYGLCPLHVHWQESFNASWPRLQTILAITGMCGAVLAGQFSRSDIEKIRKHTKNVVVIDSPVTGDIGVASVESDNLGGCKLALNHLAEQKCRRVVVITGSRAHYFSQAMMDATRQFANDFECIEIVEADYTIQGGRDAIRKLWESGKFYDGIFSNDTMALGANYALSGLGLKIPEQVKLIGFDNIIYGESSIPPLSTIDINKAKLGGESVKTLIEMVRGNKEVSQIKKVIPAKLIIRESTI
jgi:LacI family transcriptional regulator